MAPAIFLIDPDYCSRTVMRFHLAQAGYTVYDGESTATLPEGVQPQLLIIDEQAHHTDGRPVLETLEHWSGTPLLVLTRMQISVNHPFYAVHYVKPLRRKPLLLRVEELLKTRRSQHMPILHPAV